MDQLKQAIKEDDNDSFGYDNKSENEDDEQQMNDEGDKFQRNKLGLAFEQAEDFDQVINNEMDETDKYNSNSIKG